MPPRPPAWLRPGVQAFLLFALLNGCMCHEPLAIKRHTDITWTDPPESLLSGGANNVPGGDCEDKDGDGYGVGAGCLGPDCDESDPALGANGTRSCYTGPEGTRGVGACVEGTETCQDGVLFACSGEGRPGEEVCDGVDNDCDGALDEQLVRGCYDGPDGTDGVGVCHGGQQTCVAGDWGTCSGEVMPSAETCDALDNDCNGETDEQVVRTCYDGPSGTAGVGVCTAGTQTCSNGVFGDCTGQVLPTAETCDAQDNNCDGQVDEALVRACYDGPSGTAGVGVCRLGAQVCVAGSYGACQGEVLPAEEVCDGEDNDCDGAADELLFRACYGGPAGTEGVGVCTGGTQLCSGGSWGACAGEVGPSVEVCDAKDNDCDGTADEDVVRACYGGPPGTRDVGVCRAGTQTCSNGAFGGCEGEVGPSAEVCDALDNDCNGETDEQLVRSCYGGPVGTEDVGVCHAGTQTCSNGAYGACQGEVTPSTETCDALDNNCDGRVDEQLVRSCYEGPSGTEGVGVCQPGSQTCAAGAWGTCAGATMPAQERCDGQDNDCNGSTDENISRFVRDGESQEKDPIFRPVDIVVVIDNSGSMTDEISAVENNINTNFASILDASGIDYRVILLSKHGSASRDQSICVRSPLSGNGDCRTPATCPVNGPRFFHYSVEIASHDSLWQILHTYNTRDACNLAPQGWSQWLRPGAMRVFLEVTDDAPRAAGKKVPASESMTAASFESQLFALTPAAFGTATQRNYVFHTIAGLKENVPVTAPWLPPDPLVTGLCTGNGGNVYANGLEYQKLSKASGGLRYPICQYQSFDAVFREIARKVVAGAQLACTFPVSVVPDDSTLDNTYLEFWPTNGGAVQVFQHVADEASCTPTGFYVVGNTVYLCPGACNTWRQDPTADIEVLFTCTNQVGARP